MTFFPVKRKAYAFGLFGLSLISISGCSDLITAHGLGVDKVQTNQCLSSDLTTNEGIVIPRGTKGYLQQNLGRESFVITNRMTSLPTAYDVTGQQKYMAACPDSQNRSVFARSIDQITTASVTPVRTSPPPVQPTPVMVQQPAQSGYGSPYPTNPAIPTMPVQPSQTAQGYPPQNGYGRQTIYRQPSGYPPIQR